MKWCTAILTLLCSPFALAISSPAQSPSRTWITNVTILSPENLDNPSAGSVLIENGKVTRVDRRKNARAPRGAKVVDGKGQFLMPGLMDSHVHLASVPGVPLDEVFDPHKPRPEMIRRYFEQLPRSYLYFGYTTVVDLIVLDPTVLDHFRQAPLHPDLYDCGPALPVNNGYPMALAPPDLRYRLFPNWLLDPQRTSDLPAGYNAAEHTPAAAVARVKNEGGICVKTFFERGFGADRNLPVITPELIAQVRQAAHQDGLILMMHANSFEAQTFAVNAHVDVIAHGMWNWGALNKSPEIPPEIRSLLDRIVEDKIAYQPTIQVMRAFRATFDPEYLRMPAIKKVIPHELLDWFNSDAGQAFNRQMAGERKEPDAVIRQAYERGPIRRVNQVVAYLAAKHARLIFGTDTPSAPTYGNLPGLNGYLEMQDLYRAGMSLPQIFRAATIENARTFHLDSKIGSIQPGKIANLILLKKSPLQSVDAYDSIVTVWVRGEEISRESLAANVRQK